MNRILTLILAFAFFSTTSEAQNDAPRNSFKFGLGTVFIQPADYFGNNTMHVQYEHTLFKPVRLFADAFRINADQLESTGNEKITKATQLDAGLNLALFSNENNALKLGGGGTWQSSEYRFTTSIERDSNGMIINKVFDEVDTESFGWMASLDYEVYVVRHIVLGSRITYKNYKEGDRNYFFGINAGFRF